MPSCSDQELLLLARRLDQASLIEIYDRFSDCIYYYALRRLGDPSLAEDCAADTFSRLLSALRVGGGPKEELRAYLYRSAHNWIIDHYRRRPALPLDAEYRADSPEGDPGEAAEQNILRERVRRALRLLTPEQQQVITLRFIEGWDLDEIAASLQKPVGAVKALQHRGVASLRTILAEREGSM